MTEVLTMLAYLVSVPVVAVLVLLVLIAAVDMNEVLKEER